MKKFRIWLLLLAVIGGAQSARPQTRSFISGFELGSLAEGFASGSGGSVQSAVVRSGGYAYRANPSYSNTTIGFTSRASGGGLRQIFRSSRFYIKIASLPLNGSVAIVKIGGAATFNPEVDLNWDGKLILADSWYPQIAKSTNALAADGQWHRVEFDVGYGLRVYVDGALWASGGTATYPPGIAMLFGAGASPTTVNTTADLYFDDILIDAGSFAGALPGDGHAVLLRTTSDPVTLNSWTGGAGSDHGLWMPVRNVPPAGLPAASATNMSQIKNGGKGTNLDYKPWVQSYQSAGVSGTVTAVMAICSDGQDSNKQVKSGGVWIASNPSQAAGGYSFDYGDSYNVAGTFPSGWTTHAGPVVSNPAVNLAGAPVAVVRRSNNSNSPVAVDLLGVYVDYR